ncbi:hypothetical protein OROGR_007864 [Orobanche gracilis]
MLISGSENGISNPTDQSSHRAASPHVPPPIWRCFWPAKDFHFVVVLLSAAFILVTCKHCALVENQYEFESCSSYRGSLDSPDVTNVNVASEPVSGHLLKQHRLDEIVCHPSSSFCFPSTLSGFEDGKPGGRLEALHASEVRYEGLSSGLRQESSASQLPYHDNLRYLGERNISCSLYREDGFLEFSSSDRGNWNGLTNDVSSCVGPLYEEKNHSSMSMGNIESFEFSFADGLSTPPVEVKPSLLDWGHNNMYHPSLAFITVKNLDTGSVLSVYDPSSSDSQFYPYNYSAVSLAPGEEASICFIFFPTHLGLSSAKLIIQTNFGGFLVQARGFSVESPYLINPLNGVEISSGGRWRKNLSLFNPFGESLHVKEVTAWVSISSGNMSMSLKSICRATHNMEYSSDHNVLNAKDWSALERAEVGKPQTALRPRESWVVGPRKTEAIVELDISGHSEGKVVGAFCIHLLRPTNNEIDTVMIPLEAELSLGAASGTGLVSLSLEALVPCSTSGSISVALSVRNDASYSLSFIKATHIGENLSTLQIQSVDGLILFPSTTNQVAFINYYAHMETREVETNCKIVVLINDTRFSKMEIPCIDVIGVCFGSRLNSYVGYNPGIDVDYLNGGQGFFSSALPLPSSGIKVVNTRAADELLLRNWKSQATVSLMSVLDKNEVLFPTVLVGNYSSEWISVKNPGSKPVVMQLILNSGQVIDNCRISEMHLQPSSSNMMLGNNSIAPTRYGFSIANDAITEAFVHPHGSASLGPILFQPSNRCEWRSSALIRNNLSGVEWLSLQASGGSLSLVLHEGYDPVQSLEFKLNLPSRLNFSSPDALYSIGGRKTPYCSQFLKKEVFAKNMGDLPLEIIRIKVSGAECGLDGFVVRNCTGFSLQPGEYVRLHISHQTDFAAATVRRDLELVLAAGILVIPMKASIPVRLLNLCKRSMFWVRVRKAMAVLIFAASLMYFIIWILFPYVTSAFAPQDLANGKNSFYSATRALIIFRTHFTWEKSGTVFPETNEVVKSIAREEALPVEYKRNLNPSEAPSSPSSVLNVDMQGALDSRDMRVRVGNEKGRRRRRKKSSGVGALISEASSSQSSNSTPSSPLSPGTCTTPMKHVEGRNPFSRVPLEQNDRSRCSKTSPKVNNHLDNKVRSKNETNSRASFPCEKPHFAKKAVVVAVPNSAASPSRGGSLPSWSTYRSSSLAPASTISPHARAPGKKLESRKSDGLEEKMGFEQKYTYDIWGDHLFGLPLDYQSKNVPGKPSRSDVENDSESFFVRGPQTLVKNYLLQSVVSDLQGNE